MKLDIIFLKYLDKIKRFKNPVLDIVKSKINKNSKYKIFLNKTQFNNLLEKGFIKYKLTDSKKRMNIQKGDGIGSLLSMAFNMIKPALTKNSYYNRFIRFINRCFSWIKQSLNKKRRC